MLCVFSAAHFEKLLFTRPARSWFMIWHLQTYSSLLFPLICARAVGMGQFLDTVSAQSINTLVTYARVWGGVAVSFCKCPIWQGILWNVIAEFQLLISAMLFLHTCQKRGGAGWFFVSSCILKPSMPLPMLTSFHAICMF